MAQVRPPPGIAEPGAVGLLIAECAQIRNEIRDKLRDGLPMGDAVQRRIAKTAQLEAAIAEDAIPCSVCSTNPAGNKPSSGPYELHCPQCNHTPGRAPRSFVHGSLVQLVNGWNALNGG